MTIKQQGGIFGRNPTFKDVEAEDLVVTDNIQVDSDIRIGPANSSQGQIELAKGSGAFMRFRRIDDVVVTGNNIGGMEFYTEDTNSAGVGAIIKGVAGGNGGQVDLQFHTGTGGSTANAMTIEDGGDVIVETGNLVIGTSGKGIDFSATSGTGTSELFDDYEEGTWTPVVADASSGGNTGSGTFYGHYTKVGNLVTVTGSLRDINTSGMTTGNPIYVQGLPYTCSSLTGTIIFTGSVQATSLSFTGFVSGSVADNASYLRFFDTSSGGGFSTVPLSAITSGTTDIYFTTTYQA